MALVCSTFLGIAQPVANFTANKTAGCSPLTVQFTSTSTGTITSYVWSFGNSNTSILQNPSATYIVPGTYTVVLTVGDGSVTDTKTQIAYITVYANPIANFTGTPLVGCAPLTVNFTDASTPGSAPVNIWSWDFGNGQTGTAKNPPATYVLPGTYPVSLSVKDVNGCENSIIKPAYIVVTAPFVPNFTASGNVSCTVPATVNFTATTNVPGTYTYAWTFGDGGTSTLANPPHSYGTAGVYDVEVEITSSSGCKQKKKITAFAQIASLNANFTGTPSTMCAPAFINLTNTTTPSAGVVYMWQLNGGQDYFTTNTNYTLVSKVNQITLIARDAGGCFDTIRKTITLEDRPVADFVSDQDTFCAVPATVNFTDASSGAYNSWAWNFDNTLGSTNANPSTTYTQAGTYDVRLIVSRGGSCKDTANHTIFVSPPEIHITAQHRKGNCVPATIEFRVADSSLVPLTSWRWELNSVTVSTSPNFNHLLSTPGVYVFKLTASNVLGCQVIEYDTVIVGPKTLFDFSANKYEVCYSDRNVRFQYISLDGYTPDTVYWTVYNDKASTSAKGLNPLIMMPDTGWFNVRAWVLRNRCLTEVIKLLYIHVSGPKTDFSFKIDTCATDTVKFTNLTGLNNGINKFYWDFNDSGATSTQASPTHVYKYPGTYRVKLVATDSTTGCKDSMYKDVRILFPPSVKFSPLDTSVCLGTTVKFVNLSKVDSSRSIVYTRFQLTDTRYDTLFVSNFVFNQPGLFGATLTIKDNLGCTYSLKDSATVKVYDGKAGFTMTPMVGCAPLMVTVNDTSKIENAIATRKWKWTPTDSTITTIAPATFLYASAAPIQNAGFTLRLTVTDIKGCMFTASKIITPGKPKAAFTVTSVKTCGRDSVTLQATVSNQTVFNPPSYKWFLPTGNVLTQNTKLIATGDTTYDIKLVLTDGLGCTDTLVQSVKVNTLPPVIGFTASPRYLPCYLTKTPINFNDTSKAGGSPIAKRVWDIGDGRGPIQTISPIYSAIYNRPGKFDVMLTVTDSVGCVSTATIPEFIEAGGPVGSYTFNPRKGCNPLDVTFDATSPNAAMFIWDHADGNVDTFTTVQHNYIYTREGVYYPRLTLVDSSLVCDYGLDVIDSIVVLPLPKPDFTVSRSIICKDNATLFTNTTPVHPSPIVGWKWLFGTGDSSIVHSPGNVTFDTAGLFTVWLQATDANGCVGSATKPDFVTVNDDTIPPATPFVKRATVINDESVWMEYIANTEADFDKYIIYSSNSQYNKSNILETDLTELGLTTLTTPYSYKMVAVDVCFNTSEFSETHTTVNLEASPAVNSVELNWTPYNGFDLTKRYDIWRKKTEETDFSFLIAVNGDSLHYSDTSVLCHQKYTYKINTVETDSLLQNSWSDTSGAEPVYEPLLPVPQNIRATVLNNRFVKLEWHLAKHNRVFTYQIYRAIDSGEAVFYKTFEPADTVLVDRDVNVHEHTYTYTTFVVDACGGRSEPSNIARSILLKVRMVGNDVLSHDPRLDWNPYSDWSAGINHYSLAYYNDSLAGFSLFARNAENELTQTHRYVNLTQEEYCYLVTAYNKADTSIISESNIACVSTAPRMYAPNVFTINQDGINDLFFVRGVFVAEFKLQIYNRWGQQVFETTNMHEGWDGTHNGKVCESDVYVYVAEGKGKHGESKSITGNVTLMR
ncbi:MAG: PKD domain-containing protein [Bacteroidota bacterium]